MPGPYSAGAIFLQVIPSFRGAETVIAAEGKALARAISGPFDEEFEKSVGEGLKKGIQKGAKQAQGDSKKAGKDAGDAYAGAFQESMKRALTSAQREIGAITVKLDDKDAQKKIRAVNRDLKVLTDAKNEIGVDLDAGTAFRKLADLETNLRALQDSAKDIDVRVNSAVAMAQIEKVRADLMSLSAIQIEPDLKIDRAMGSFERSLKSAVQGAIDDIGEVRLDTTVAERDLADLRRQLFELGDKQIGIDIGAEEATAELARIRSELRQLNDEHWAIDLDANTAAAMAKLDSVLNALERVDGDDVNIDVDVRGAAGAVAALAAVHEEARKNAESGRNAANAFRAFNGVLFGVTTIGPAVVPVLAGIAGGLLAMGPLAVAGAAGLGVLVLGLSGIGGAVKALNQQQATGVTQQQTYARSVQSAASSVRDAEQGVADARESAARATTSAEHAVEQALAGVEDAERGVADAQQARQRAQEDLTRAVAEAREQQEDLALSLRDSLLGEKEAALKLREAQADLQAGIGEGASGDDLLKLQLKVERYQLTLDEAKERTGDLQAETAEFARTGVEGTDAVRSARERLADADANIAAAQRRVADAQASVAEARSAQDQAAADGARQVRDAQERLTDAQARYTESLTNVNSAQNKVTESMAALSPAGRDFANFLFGLKGQFQEFRYLAQEGFLPGLQGWMQTITGHYGPQLERTIFNLSSAVGGMFDKFGSSLLTKPFRDLFTMIEKDGPRFIGYLGDILVNLGEGVASLIVAMEPLADLFGGWLVQATQAFADWAAGLKGSSGLQDFFDYVRHIGPEVADFFMALGGAVVNLAKALAPFGEVLLNLLTGVAQWIARMDTDKLAAIAIGIITAIAAMQTIFGLTAGLRSIQEAWNGISSVGELLGGRWTTLLGSAILLAGAIFVLYQNSDTFRAVVDALWRNVLQPVAEFLAAVLVPVLDGLGTLLNGNIGIVAAFAGAFAAWKIFTSVAGWLDLTISKVDGLRNAMRRAGGLAGLIGGVAVAGYALDQNADEEARIAGTFGGLFGDLRKGGDDADRARRLLGAADANSGGFADTIEGFFGTSNREALDAAHNAYRQQWQDMTDLEQAQSKVAEWTNTLSDRQRNLGENSEKTAIAHQRLDYWTRQVRDAQEAAFHATTGLNASLLEQQGLAIALADADIAYSQARDALDTAFQNYQETLADVNATEEERRAAEEAWTNQSRATADAAAAVAAARHQNADAGTREAYANAALLIDLNRQKELYGELPPRLEELRQGLEGTVEPAVLAAAQMENLGLSVKAVPDSKTIILDSTTPEQIEALEALGFTVEQLPDGSFKVVAETQAAQDALDFAARDRTSTIYSQVVLGPMQGSDPKANFGRGNTGDAKPLARGGPVWGPGGPTTDSIPAWLSNGEFVVRAKAVSKYGLGLLHDINAMRFANGGFVGPQKFADGGFVANWGGTIDLKGGDVSPLAQYWVAAIVQIHQLSQVAASMIAGTFASMREAVLGQFIATKDGIAAILGAQFSAMVAMTGAANAALYAEQARYAGQTLALNAALQNTVIGQLIAFNTMRLQFAVATDTALYGEQLRHATATMQLTSATDAALYGENLRYATQFMQLTSATHATVQGMYIQFGGMLLQLMSATTSALTSSWASFGANMINLTVGMVNGIGAQFERLRPVTANPVNWVITAVLNGGLFPALNNVSSAFGLGPPIATALPVKLAAGGRVAGWSPHDKADNIPAMLTAGEFVLPVDAVNYYGPELLELLRRKELPRFATGGYVAMGNLIRQKFPFARISSGYRPGDPGYHGKGLAIDIAGSIPYPDRTGMAQMLQIDRWLAGTYGSNVTELIHTQPGAINLWHGQPHTYNAATQAEHRNHVHWAMANGIIPGVGVMGPGGGMFPWPDAAAVLASLTASMAVPVRQLAEKFGSSPFIGMLSAIPSKLLSAVWGKIGPKIEEAMAITPGDGSLTGAQTTGPVQDIVRSVARQFGWDSGAQWNSLATLIQHESGWRPTAQNPTSTAYGLFQFLNGTWGQTGIAKTSDPAQQTLAGLRYIKARYTDPVGAWNFWSRNHWYSEGGPVDGDGPITPELMDTGGWIHPGLNVIMNKTGRPEPVINPSTLDALISIGEGGAASSLIGHLEQHLYDGPTAQEVTGELLHAVTVASRGGRY